MNNDVLDASKFSAIVYEKVSKSKQFFDNFIKSRLIQNTMQFQTNEKEIDALNKIVNNTHCEIKDTGAGASMSISFDEKDKWFSILTNGMDAPLTGGQGGIAHNPDGSTYTSKVPGPLQGNPIPEFAREGVSLVDEINMMVKSLFKAEVQDAINASKNELFTILKSYIKNEIKYALGGV